MSFAYNPFTDNLDFKNEGGGGGGVQLIDTDSASVTGSTIKLLASTGIQKAGSSVSFVASDTDQINLITTDANLNTIIGQAAGNASLTGSSNTGLGYDSLFKLTSGSQNVGVGYNSLNRITDGADNVAVGAGTSLSGSCSNNVVLGSGVMTNGGLTSPCNDNVGIGFSSLTALRGGSNNVAIGSNSLSTITTGQGNTCIGYGALIGITTSASRNTAIGFNAGSSYGGTDSFNICIGSNGSTGESNAIRIGTEGVQNTCLIAGITGVTVTGTAVLCSSTGQLGTVVSSRKYKNNIKEIDKDVSVLNLKPSQFTYKVDLRNTKQYGLIAEDVHKDFPYLCFYDEKGDPESVKYHELPVFLLKEIQRLNERIINLEKKSRK